MVLGCVKRSAWSTKLLLMAVPSLVDCISLCHLLKAQLFESKLVLYPAFGSPPPTHPPPIDSIRDITGAEKTT